MNRPHPARMYDYYLGGKNHFAADRAVADAALASWPPGGSGCARTGGSSAAR